MLPIVKTRKKVPNNSMTYLLIDHSYRVCSFMAGFEPDSNESVLHGIAFATASKSNYSLR